MFCFKIVLLFFFIFLSFQQTKFPKIIWTYWTGKLIPHFSQLCLANMRQMVEKDGWIINIVNDVTIYDHIQDDQYLDKVISSYVLTTNIANKADIVRLFLMYQNGGIWLDISTILLQDFTWLDRLADNPYIYNRQQLGNFNDYPDVFLFLTEHYGSKKQQTYWKTGQKVLAKPGFQTWFIACIPKARLVYEWKKQFTQYYLQNYETYFNKGVSQEIDQRNVDYNTYFATGGALQNVIQTKQRQIDQKTSYFGGQQYAVHYYKLWTMWSEVGPLFFHQFVDENSVCITRYSIEYLKEQERYPKYFIKMVKSDRWQIDPVINKIMSENTTKKTHTQIDCNAPISLAKGSIIDKYLFSKLPKEKYDIVPFINYDQYRKKCWDPIYYLDPLALRIIQIGSFFLVSFLLLWISFYKLNFSKNHNSCKITCNI